MISVDEGIVKIEVSTDSEKYLLHFKDYSLQKCEKINSKDEVIFDLKNPFGMVSWLLQNNESSASFIMDFPHLKGKLLNQKKDFEPEDGPENGSDFSEEFKMEGELLTCKMSRQDPVEDSTHQLLTKWSAGKKWWKFAEMKLGEEIIITGALIDN